PRGYKFFTPRNRPTPAPQAKGTALPASAEKARTPTAKCCGIPEDPVPPQMKWTVAPIPVKETAAAATPAPHNGPPIRQVTWASIYGLGYGYPLEGYSNAYAGNGFAPSPRYPLHGFRPTYHWAGNSYCLNCYCDDPTCPDHCPGYRGACYRPG